MTDILSKKRWTEGGSSRGGVGGGLKSQDPWPSPDGAPWKAGPSCSLVTRSVVNRHEGAAQSTPASESVSQPSLRNPGSQALESDVLVGRPRGPAEGRVRWAPQPPCRQEPAQHHGQRPGREGRLPGAQAQSTQMLLQLINLADSLTPPGGLPQARLWGHPEK